MAKQAEKYDGSTPLKSVMQETVVSNILQGMTQQMAYRTAGYQPGQTKNSIAASASALLRNPKVKARLAYRRAVLAQNCEITEESQIKRFQHLSRVSEKHKQMSSAVSAEKEVATICGLYEHDNAQKRGKTVVEILALVANSRRQRQIAGSETSVEARALIDALPGDAQTEADTDDKGETCKESTDL